MTSSHRQRNASTRSPIRLIVLWLSRLMLAVVITFCAALVAAFSFEQYTLRPLTEFLVQRVTGRALSIEGGLEARAGSIISIRAGRIRLANADWGSRDDMLNIEETEIFFDPMRWLRGEAAIEDLAMRGVQLLLEQNKQGRSNWTMAAAEEESSSDAGRQGATPIPVVRSRLSEIDITVKSAALAQPLEIHLESAEHSADRGNELIATVVGAVHNRPLNLQARIRPVTQLLDAGAVDFDIEAAYEASTIEVDGHLDKLSRPRQATVNLTLVSPEISQLFVVFGLPQVVTGAAELKANILPVDDYHRVDFAVSTDSLNLDARTRLRSLDSMDGASVALSASGQNLATAAQLAGLKGLKGLPSQPFTIQTTAALSGKRLTISEARIDSGDNHLSAEGSMTQFPDLEDSNLRLRLAGKNYLEFAQLLGIREMEKLEAEPFELNAELDYGTQDRQQFMARIAIADVSGDFSGKLTADPAYVGSRIDYRLHGQNDALIQRLLGRPTLIEGKYSLQGSVERRPEGYRIERSALSFGANEMEVNGVIGNDPLQGGTALSMRFHGADLDKIVAIAGYTGFVPAGKAEIVAALRARDKGIYVDELSLQLERNMLQVNGLVNLQPGMSGSRAKVTLSGADIAEVLPQDLRAYVDPQQSFELTGTLAIADEQLAIDALQARLGEVSLEASGSVSTRQPLTATSLKIDARGPNLAAIFPKKLVPYSLPAAEFSLSGGVAVNAEGLTLEDVKAAIGADRLGLSGTIPLATPSDGLELALSAKGPSLKAVVPVEIDLFDFAALPYEISGNIQLAAGIMSLRQLDYSTSRGRLSGQMQVSIADPLEFGDFDLEAKGNRLDEFFPSISDFSPAAVPFDLDARGGWDSNKLRIEQGLLRLDNSNIEVQGDVNLKTSKAESRLILSARGDSLADLGQFKGLILPADDFRIHASLNGHADGLEIPALKARVGESDLHGSLQLEYAEKPTINVKLESDLLDLSKLFPPEDSTAENGVAEQFPTSNGRLIPQIPVPADRLNEFDLETRIRLGELRLPHNTLQNIAIDSTLREGELTVSRLSATAAQGQLTARFRAVADGGRIVTSGNLEGTEVVFGNDESSDGGTMFPRQNIHLEFDTSGATVRELAANLNGYAQFNGGTGRLRNSYALDLFGSFFSQLLSTINPFITREPYTTISCFAAYAEVNDGVAVINPGAVMQTDKLNIFAIGQMDLNTEKIQIRLDTGARRWLGISVGDFVNPFVGVSGTLASPRLSADPKNAMFEGGFAYATGGLSIVAKGLYRRWFGAKDPCARLQQDAQKVLQERQDRKEKQESAADEQ